MLFLYSTQRGQSRRICERMADEARSAGWRAQIMALDDPDAATALAQAGFVVIGASIYYGYLSGALYAFICAHRALLEARPNAFFCVNLTARKPGKDTPEGNAYMRRFLKKSAWRPQRLAAIAGALEYTRYGWLDREAIRLIMRITGGPTDPRQDHEFTDWERVRAIAREWFGAKP